MRETPAIASQYHTITSCHHVACSDTAETQLPVPLASLQLSVVQAKRSLQPLQAAQFPLQAGGAGASLPCTGPAVPSQLTAAPSPVSHCSFMADANGNILKVQQYNPEMR